jgi:hypothetical protein
MRRRENSTFCGGDVVSEAKREAAVRAEPDLSTHLLGPTKGAEDQETCGDANAGVSDVE